MSRSAFGTAPWRRAPLLLVRRPVVFLAIAAATAILALAAASGPLFLSTIGTASLHAQAQQTCPENSRPGLVAETSPQQLAPTARRAAAAMVAQGLPAPRVVAVGETTVQKTLVHVYSGPGALDHVRLLTPRGRAGVWVPDTLATPLGLRPGGTIVTAGGRAPVAGLYRDLAPDPFVLADLPRYWCSWSDAIVPRVASETAPAASSLALTPGKLVIADRATVARLTPTPRLYVHSPLSTATHPTGEFRAALGKLRAAVAVSGGGVQVDDHLQSLLDRARTSASGVGGAVVPIELAGVVIAGLLVGGAGFFWANARRREIALLVARGVGPAALGTKAVLETLPAAVTGAALGWGLTIVIVRAVGPVPVLEDGAPLQALGIVAGAVLVGLLLIAAIGATAGRERSRGRRAAWPQRVPWELGLVAAAAIIGVVRLDRPAVSLENNIVSISPLVVLYPLLGVTGLVLLVGRLLGLVLPALGRRSAGGPTSWFLALRRMSRSRAIAVGLVVGTALPCCLLLYAATVRGTVAADVDAKYRANLGAPHVLQVYGVRGALFDLHGAGTQVVRYEQDSTLGSTPVTVMGVDRATFARFAFLSGSQRSALDRLGAPRSGAVPAIVANADGVSGRTVHIADTTIPIRTISRQVVFPGLRDGSSPLVVVDQRILSRVDNVRAERTNQVWTDDTHYGAARRIVADLRYSVLFELTSKVVIDSSGLLPVTWVFGYLQALAVLIGLVALTGLVFGLAARTRSRRVAYVLSRRMGMSRRTHVASLLIELGLVLGFGWVIGSASGVGSFRLVLDELDVYPDLPPPPAFTVPSTPLLVSAAVVVAVTVLAAAATQALAQRTRPAEILRLE